jgi:hypothetical protein
LINHEKAGEARESGLRSKDVFLLMQPQCHAPGPSG